MILLASILELTGLVLVIPYVNMMLDNEVLLKYINDAPLLQYILFGDDYRLWLSLLFAGFYVFKNILLAIFVFIQQIILTGIEAGIASRMYDNYLFQPYSYHLSAHSPELIRNVTYDTLVFVDGILSKGALLITELLLLCGVLITLIAVQADSIFILLIMIMPIVIVYLLIRWHLKVWGEILQRRETQVINYLQEGLEGIKDIIMLGVSPFFSSRFKVNVINRAHVKRNRGVAIAVPRFVIESMMMITMAIVLMWLARGEGLQQHLSLIAFLSIVTVRLLPMSTRVLASISSIRASGPSIDAVYRNVNSQQENIQNITPGTAKHIKETQIFQTLRLVNASYRYPNTDELTLNKISFSIYRGEMVGIVGGSGAGKTTLVDTILGLLELSSGEVYINDKSITNNISEWRNYIGYVQQSVYLVDATIAENIAFGISSELIDRKRVREVLCTAKLDEWIDSLQLGIESFVGERGIRISGGQRQRIGIARALYNNPQVLVLDEATSSLDNLTEHEIMEDIYSLHGKKTLIMIAHRLDTIRRCDRIFVLNDGKLVGEGNYNSLLKNNDIFKKISMQKGTITSV